MSLGELAQTLFFQMKDQDKKELLFLGSLQGDGVTYTTHKLAKAFAEYALDLKILLVDANFTDPSLSEMVGWPETGWTSTQGTSRSPEGADFIIQTAVRIDKHHRIDVLPMGHVGEAGEEKAPSGVGALELFPLRMQQCRDIYDIVLIDGPPVLIGAETVFMARLAEMVVFIISAGRNRRPVVVEALKALNTAGVKPAGAILNRRQFFIPRWVYRFFF